MSRLDLGRVLTVAAVLACVGPPLVVGLAGLGLPPVPAAIAVVLAFGAAAAFPRIPPLPLDAARRRPLVAALWVLMVAAASYQTVRASLFAYDPALSRYSVAPGDPFRTEHCCLTAYAEAARFAAEGRPVYDPGAYLPGGARRRIGPLTVDPFHYPPPFLLLPSAVRLVAPDFLATRRVWFALQAVVMAAGLLGVAWWVGGAAGSRMALLAPMLWGSPHTFFALQTGNFQTTAMVLALGGCLLAASSRTAAGAALLAGAAAAKLFPAVLVLHVVAWARVRLIAAIAVAGLGYVLVSLAVYGVGTWREFLVGELPRLLSGEAFPQIRNPGNAVVNLSFFGLVAKLRGLGLAAMDYEAGRMFARVCFVVIAAGAVWTGRRVGRLAPGGALERAPHAMLWLAVLNGAAFISPFVGVAYGGFGTAWLAVIAMAAAPARRARMAALLAFVLLSVALIAMPSPVPTRAPEGWLLGAALATQLVVLAVSAWAVSAWAGARRPARAPSR